MSEVIDRLLLLELPSAKTLPHLIKAVAGSQRRLITAEFRNREWRCVAKSHVLG